MWARDTHAYTIHISTRNCEIEYADDSITGLFGAGPCRRCTVNVLLAYAETLRTVLPVLLSNALSRPSGYAR